MRGSENGRPAACEYTRDGQTWEPVSRDRVRARAGQVASDALAAGEVETVTSKDGTITYRRKPKEEA